MEVFGQTICITLVGMGLTLAAVGILLVAMLLLFRRVRGSAAAAPGQQQPGPAIPAHQSLAEAEQAAAVAVAIALALAARQIHPTRTWHSASPQEDLSPWQGYARGQQLERRKTQQMLRWYMAIYRVTVGGNEYQVEIEDVNTQPVRALVNGQLVQVWVQDRQVRPASFEGRPAPQATPATPSLVVPSPPPDQSEAGESGVRAPMPGSIVSVAVQPGDRVEAGQDVCVLEAMKMKNHIRAPRSGTIAQVSVSPGQQVQHGDLLVTFTD